MPNINLFGVIVSEELNTQDYVCDRMDGQASSNLYTQQGYNECTAKLTETQILFQLIERYLLHVP